MVFLARKNRACTQPPARAPISNLIFLKKEAPPGRYIPYTSLNMTACSAPRSCIMHLPSWSAYVRHSACATPPLSEPAWFARVFIRGCSYVCVCVYICVHFLQGEKKRRERKKMKRRRKDCSDDAVTVAFPKLLFPTFFLSFLSLFHSVQRGVGATRRSAFRGEKFRVSVGTRAEFAGLSRLIREGIRKRAE